MSGTKSETVRLPNGVEVLAEDSRLETLRLPRGLSRRIQRVVENDALGYSSFDDFCLEAIRRQLERSEKTSYFLKEGTR